MNPAMILALGYTHPRQLEDGRWIALLPMAYTTGLFVGIDATGYSHRYCFETDFHALKALWLWDGEEHPPGPWIKRKGEGGDLLNPAWANEPAPDRHVQSLL